MDLDELRKNWDEFGKQDPMWSIVTDETRRGSWDAGEFFATGVRDVSALMSAIEALGLPKSHDRMLDFGCGLGRMTQAFCEHFGSCAGVDIAASMVEQARAYNEFGDRCEFHVNDATLAFLDDASFDLVFSTIVLQHMEPILAKLYVGEFIRVLRPGGIAVFDCPIQHRDDRVELPVSTGFELDVQASRCPRSVVAGRPFEVTVTVRNDSDRTWLGGPDGLRVGNHWRSADGELLVRDDARVELPDLEPGRSAHVSLHPYAPDTMGELVLELSVVKEAEFWLEDYGGAPACVDVVVGASGTKQLRSQARAAIVRALPTPIADRLRRLKATMRPAAHAEIETSTDAAQSDSAATSDETGPVMEMHTVPYAEMLAVIDAAGGKLVAQRTEIALSAPWISVRYFVSK